MRKILILVADLNFHGLGRQASLLAGALPDIGFSVEVLCMTGLGPFAAPLLAQGVPIQTQKGRRLLNLTAWLALRQRIKIDPPDVIHVFGLKPLRELGLALLGFNRRIPAIVVSLSLSGWHDERAGLWSRSLLRRASAVVVANEAERERMIHLGFPPESIHAIRPGVPVIDVRAGRPRSQDSEKFRASLGIPSAARLILSVGEMNRLDRMHAVFWGFDILHYVDESVHALVIGDGPYRHRTETNARSSMFDDYRIHFLGSRPDAAALLDLAEIIWVVPGSRGGTYAVLEGMAAGRPVIATALPHLSAILKDGVTGQLIPPADPPALARVSHKLLQDGSLCHDLGSAARNEIETSFRVDTMVQRFAEMYDSAARGR